MIWKTPRETHAFTGPLPPKVRKNNNQAETDTTGPGAPKGQTRGPGGPVGPSGGATGPLGGPMQPPPWNNTIAPNPGGYVPSVPQPGISGIHQPSTIVGIIQKVSTGPAPERGRGCQNPTSSVAGKGTSKSSFVGKSCEATTSPTATTATTSATTIATTTTTAITAASTAASTEPTTTNVWKTGA